MPDWVTTCLEKQRGRTAKLQALLKHSLTKDTSAPNIFFKCFKRGWTVRICIFFTICWASNFPNTGLSLYLRCVYWQWQWYACTSAVKWLIFSLCLIMELTLETASSGWKPMKEWAMEVTKLCSLPPPGVVAPRGPLCHLSTIWHPLQSAGRA